MGGWYVVYCRAGCDEKAAENLTKQQYEVYRPLIKRPAQKNNIYSISTHSMFPRYLFIRPANTRMNFMAINSTRGVKNLVSFSGIAPEIPEWQIDSIRHHEFTINKSLISSDDSVEKRTQTGHRLPIPDNFASCKDSERLAFLMQIIETSIAQTGGKMVPSRHA